jgi:hypothetical protein
MSGDRVLKLFETKQGERIEELEALLTKIRSLLDSKPLDCLGSTSDGQIVWPIRDEVIADITKTLQR